VDREENPRELERRIAQASRLAFRITDDTTAGRLRILVEELKGKLKRLQNGGALAGRD
jgi:hypothetical protein